MTLAFTVIVIFDGWLDGSITTSIHDDKNIQGSIFCLLIAIMAIPANLELAKLAKIKNIHIFKFIAITTSILFATTWYWVQIFDIRFGPYIAMVAAFSLFAIFICQYRQFATNSVIINCGATCFAIFYLGILSLFTVALRIEFGTWPLLMSVFVVKFADIGAYTFGKLFGKHKFSPNISPGKTWEGMAGAVVVATLLAVLFAICCDIMAWPAAVLFGICFAFIGQLGDWQSQ